MFLIEMKSRGIDMKKLTCEMCGSTDLIKKDGVFVCQFCDCKYSVEEAKKIMFEGAVEITKGEVEKERLLKNAETFLTLDEVSKARDIYVQISNDYPDDARGWFGLACIEKNEMYDYFESIKSDDLVSYYNVTYAPSPFGTGVLSCLSRLNYFNEKLIVLDYSYAEKIKHYETQFVKDYEARELPFINVLSASVLCHYNIVKKCSDIIQKWAGRIVCEYIKKFNTGEVMELYWRVVNPYEEKNLYLYPDAIPFLKEAYDNAEQLKTLDSDELHNFLKAIRINRAPSTSGECVFWKHKTLLFSNTGYDHSFTIYNTQYPIDSSNVSKFVSEKSKEIESKCTEAMALLSKMYNVEAVLECIIKNFASADTKIRKASYDWETNFSYKVTKINASSIEYVASYNWNECRKNETKHVCFNQDVNFDDVIIVIRKYSNKCSFCGGKFKGIFTKVCSVCDKPKNY